MKVVAIGPGYTVHEGKNVQTGNDIAYIEYGLLEEAQVYIEAWKDETGSEAADFLVQAGTALSLNLVTCPKTNKPILTTEYVAILFQNGDPVASVTDAPCIDDALALLEDVASNFCKWHSPGALRI